MKEIVDEIYKEIKQELYESIKSTETTVVLLSTAFIKFPEVYYKQKYTQTLKITNKNNFQVPILLKLPLSHDRLWLSLNSESLVIPSNASCDLEVTVNFTEQDSIRGNIDPEYLLTHFKLFIVGSREYTVQVNAEYMGSCFGASLYDLVKISDRVACPNNRLQARAKESNESVDVPKPLVTMVEFILAHSGCAGLFDSICNNDDAQAVRYALDTGESISSFNVHVVCSVLVEFLDSLPCPIIDFEKFDSLIALENWENKSDAFFQKVDTVTEKTLKYLLSFFKTLVNKPDTNISCHLISHYFLDPLTHIEKLGVIEHDPTVTMKQRYSVLEFLINSN